MKKEEVNQTEPSTEAQENPLEKLSIEELEKNLVDSEQTIKGTKAELKDHIRIEELASQIKAHRGDPKWKDHKDKIAAIKEQEDELKAEKQGLQGEIDEAISDEIAEKLQLEAPYREIIKAHNANIKQVLIVLESKGRVIQRTEEDEEQSNEESSKQLRR